MSLIDTIPGLGEAIEREQSIRTQSFLSLPDVVCGVEVPHLTLAHVLLLGEIGSPLVRGGPVTPYDVGVFFLTLNGSPKGFKRWRLLRQVGKMPAEQTTKAVVEFVEESFQDAPPSGRGGEVSYYSFAAALVDCFASEYSWREEDILNTPMKRLFQYLKAITKRNNPNAIQFNPSDKVKGRWLVDVNEGRIKLN